MSIVDEACIQAEALEIAVFLVCPSSSPSRHGVRMKQQVDRIIHRHEILFTGIVRKLDSLAISGSKNNNNNNMHSETNDDLLCLDLTRIFNNLIKDGNITWGKIITIFAFSTFVAKKHREIADHIAQVTGQYVAKHMAIWIEAHGGWDGMSAMDSTTSIEDLHKMFTFSLTCIGLSLLFLLIALR